MFRFFYNGNWFIQGVISTVLPPPPLIYIIHAIEKTAQFFVRFFEVNGSDVGL